MSAPFAVDSTGVARRIHRRKRWTTERRARLVALALVGHDRPTIAERLGVSPHAVSCEMSRLGLTIKSLNTIEL